MDYLEELSIQLGGVIRSQNHLNPNFKIKSVRCLVIKNYKSFKVQIDQYGNLFTLGIKVNSDLAFSINNPDNIFNYNKLLNLENFAYKLYVSDTNYKVLKYKPLDFFWLSLANEIKKIKLNCDESIFFYKNIIYFALHPNRNLASILDDIINLINSNEEIFKKDIKLNIKSKNIPEILRPLFPLLKKWSIADDSEREQLIGETIEKQKKKLIGRVGPFMIDINNYLDSFGDEPLSEEAILLGNLAELISELKTG